MMNYKPTTTPIATIIKLSKEDIGSNAYLTLFKILVDSLTYLTTIKPKNLYHISLISRLIDSSKGSHCKQKNKKTKKLRCIIRTTRHDIFYSNTNCNLLVGYTNSHFASIMDDRKSTSR